MTRKYEIMYIIDQNISTDDLKELNSKLLEILSDNGKIIKKNELGLLDFAYEINHSKKGYYFVAIVETNSESIREFERISKIEKHVVRTLVLNTETTQNWEESVILSKTDMTAYEEEQNERRNFRKSFIKKNIKNNK